MTGKVLADFSLPDGRLKESRPTQELEVVLRHVGKAFQRVVEIYEKQVNKTLARFHADTWPPLRRELVGYGFMKRGWRGWGLLGVSGKFKIN